MSATGIPRPTSSYSNEQKFHVLSCRPTHRRDWHVSDAPPAWPTSELAQTHLWWARATVARPRLGDAADDAGGGPRSDSRNLPETGGWIEGLRTGV